MLRLHNDSHFKVFHLLRDLLIPNGYKILSKYYSNSSNRVILIPRYGYGKMRNAGKSFHSSSKVFEEKKTTTSCCDCNSKAISGDKSGKFSSRQGWNNRLLPKSLIGIQGAAFSKGQPHDGVAEGPFVIRETGIIKLLRDELGQDVVDFGDIPLTDASHNHKSRKKTETEKKEEKAKKCKDKNPKVGVGPETEKMECEEREKKQQKEFDKRQRKKIREVDKAKTVVYSAAEMGHNYNKLLKNTVDVAAANKLISQSTTNILKDGRICVTLGGDHSISIGTVNGATEVCKDMALLWIDAHTDINTIHSTSSGNFHGTPVSFCVVEMQKYMSKVPGFEWVKPRIKAENMAYIATRSVDPDERMYLDILGIRTYDAADVDRMGARAVIRSALDRISPDKRRPIHVSFDIDALDNLDVISTGTPVPGGITLREALVIAEEIYKHGMMVSMDLVEVNPEIGTKYDAKRSADCAARILYAILGGSRQGIADPDKNLPKMNEE